MKITRRQLRRIIKEAMHEAERTLYVDDTVPFGPKLELEDPNGELEWIGLGEMVKELIDSGQTEFAPEEQIAQIIQRDKERVQGGMHRWDNDVFMDYYDVDFEKVVNLWSSMKNVVPEWATPEGEDDPDYEDDGEHDFESYYS